MTNRTLLRAAEIRSQSFNPDDNTIEITWTTGAAVQRSDWDGDYVEVLSLEPGAVRLDRLNNGAPYLNTHSSWDLSDVLGSVVPGSARIEGGRGIATIKLSGAAADAGTIGKIRDGVIRNNSVGYLVHGSRDSEEDGVITRLVTDWEPLEISAVPIPADPGAQIRSHGRRRAAAPRKVSRRAAEIRDLARRAGLPKFGEKHVAARTSADDFFWLLAARLQAPKRSKESSSMDENEKQRRQFAEGKRWAERTLGRAATRDEEPAKTSDDDDDGEADDADAKVCPTCGSVVDSDDLHDDDDDEGGDDDTRDDEDGDDRKRSLRHGRRVHAAPLHDHRVAPRQPRTRESGLKPHGGLDLGRANYERGAAAFRKLAGKR